MSNKKETYNRSRMAINSFIVNLCTKKYLSNGQISPDMLVKGHGFSRNFYMPGDDGPQIGALCSLIGAPHTKYYLSWYLGVKDGAFMLMSIEDHSIARWSSVMIQCMPLDIIMPHPQFMYSDRQFKFQDRWKKIVEKTSYWMVPMWSEFNNETGEVTLIIRWKFKDVLTSKKFDLWEQITNEEMIEFAKEVESSGIK